MKELASLENKIKLMTFAAGLMSMYFAIKSDIRELYTEKRYEVEHLQYQIEEIKLVARADILHAITTPFMRGVRIEYSWRNCYIKFCTICAIALEELLH